MQELLLADEISLQAYALASFKMYEKVKRRKVLIDRGRLGGRTNICGGKGFDLMIFIDY